MSTYNLKKIICSHMINIQTLQKLVFIQIICVFGSSLKLSALAVMGNGPMRNNACSDKTSACACVCVVSLRCYLLRFAWLVVYENIVLFVYRRSNSTHVRRLFRCYDDSCVFVPRLT